MRGGGLEAFLGPGHSAIRHPPLNVFYFVCGSWPSCSPLAAQRLTLRDASSVARALWGPARWVGCVGRSGRGPPLRCLDWPAKFNV